MTTLRRPPVALELHAIAFHEQERHRHEPRWLGGGGPV